MNSGFQFSIVVPCFNEEGNIRPLYQSLVNTLGKYEKFEILIVDDGSQDESVAAIKQLRSNDQRVKCISLSRNFGHQAAVKAGLDHATGDFAITMDADLQHPPEVIDQMIEKWKEGSQIVYTRRKNNRSYAPLKRILTYLFYKIISWLAAVKIEEGAADFRLIDRKVIDLIRPLNDNFLFLRGLLPWMGFSTSTVFFAISDRYSGKTKYTFRKMVRLAINGITSFSIKPLRLSMLTGLILSVLSFLYAIYAIYAKFYDERVVEGWTSVLVAVLFIGGMQLIMIGIIGEYLGKLFIQSKGRQAYIIKEMII